MKIQSIVYKFLSLYSVYTVFAFFNPVMAQLEAQKEVILQQADSLFSEQRYTQAYKAYEKVLQTGEASPGMLLRMAYIQESLGNTSSTLYLLSLYYQQTSDREALAKIQELAAEKNLKGYEYSDMEYFRSILMQNRQLIVMGLMILTGALFLLVVYRKFRKHEKPVWLGVLVVLLLAGTFYFVNTSLVPQRAIVSREGVLLMSGPSAGSSMVQQIDKGHRLKVLGKEDVWYRVEWNNQVLYVKENAVTQV